MLRKTILALVAIAILAPMAAAEECEKRSMPIMYRHMACQKAVGAISLSFWVSDLSFLEKKEQPEYSASCRRKKELVYRPHGCVGKERDDSDYVVVVSTFVSKRHFCNFTLPQRSKDNLLRAFGGSLAEPDSSGLQLLQTRKPRAFENYYAALPPKGEVLIKCMNGDRSCELMAVAEDGEHLFEISFPGESLKDWKTLLSKTQAVAARCI